MIRKAILITGAGLLLNLSTLYATGRYVGGDISLLPVYEEAGAQYKDLDGTPIQELLPYLHREGMNAMRVRVFVNPQDYKGDDADANACQTIENVIPLCQRIKEQGMALMIDFHYSDTWADPAKQYTPLIWSGLNDEELAEAVYEYTLESLQYLADNGVTPDFIQTGNEISYGMLWGPEGTSPEEQKKTFLGSDDNWNRLGNILRKAGEACREVCPDAKIVLHTERTADIPVQNNFYSQMERMGIDYDIIGLSYYPYFHGPLSSLQESIEDLESHFGSKDIMVVETGYSYKWEVPGTSCPVTYPYSEDGQAAFTRDLVDMLKKHTNVNGLFWWWMEYNAYGTDLSNWYNAPLFDSTNGKAMKALRVLCSFADDENMVKEVIGGKGSNSRNIFFDLKGNRWVGNSHGVVISETGRKLVVK